MSIDLSKYYYLPRAGQFANCLNSNDRLPIVYGDLTDGNLGNWISPCIDSTNYVYCYAAHPCLSTALGNSINVYVDNALKDPSTYTYSTGNSTYAGYATIKFVASQGDGKVTIRGKGMDSGGVLIENIIEIGQDFLLNEVGISSTQFDDASCEVALARFDASSYVAAGAITEDAPAWTIIQQMIGSFNGMAFYNNEKKLVIDFDPGGTNPQYVPTIIRKSDIANITAKHTISNLINRCPVSFAYNYAAKEFRRYTNTDAYADLISEENYGSQTPTSPLSLYWIRSLTMAQKIQDVIVGLWSNPVWEISLKEIALKNINLDVGDIISLTIDFLYGHDGDILYNENFKITSIVPDPQRQLVSFRAMDQGNCFTTAKIFDGTWRFGLGYENLVTNSGFDSDTSSWDIGYACTIASIAGGEPGNCCELTVTINDIYQSFSQFVSPTPGERYVVKGKVKSGTAGHKLFTFGIWDYSRMTASLEIWGTSTTAWVSYQDVFTSPQVQVSFYAAKQSTDSGTMLFDSLKVFSVDEYYTFGNDRDKNIY